MGDDDKRAQRMKTLYELVEAAYDERAISQRTVVKGGEEQELVVTLRFRERAGESSEAFRRAIELVQSNPI